MIKLICFGLLISLSCIASGCYSAPKANTSRTSTTSETPTTAPYAEKSATPASSQTPPSSPAKSGGYEQAFSDYNSKNFEKAEAGFKEVIAADPKHADANYHLGNIYYSRKEYEKSLPHFEEAAKIDFKSVDKLMAWGENQRVLKQFDRAIVQYQRVIGFDPDNANAYYALGLTYVGLKNSIAASQQLKKLEPLNKSLAEKLSKEIDSMK